jgi:predicted dithiol-disulfide oxidoreductase (DUF899 family)
VINTAEGDAMTTHEVVSKGEWLRARKRLLTKEKEFTRIGVFAKDESGAIFRTYSTYGRGIDMMNTAYHYLDLVPKGRDEAGQPHAMAWVKLRDVYDR